MVIFSYVLFSMVGGFWIGVAYMTIRDIISSKKEPINEELKLH